ncbi:MAG: chorismate mutase [Ectothiorhodospiraceae bacterium AqS1]|nr:chorismate mutase [Ectothiorhodospiraceae bacterium AqS1]
MSKDPADPPWSGARRASPPESPPVEGESLDALRAIIDSIDEEILALLDRRAQVALEVGNIKSSLAVDPRYYRPEREAQLLSRLAASQKRLGGALPISETIRLFREIASSCRSLEQRLAIAWSDPWAMHAALGHFGGAIDLRRFESEEEALLALAARQCDYAMIAFTRDGHANPLLAGAALEGQSLIGEWKNEKGDRFLVAGREPVPVAGIACNILSIAAEDKEALEGALLCASPTPTVDFYPFGGRSRTQTKPSSLGLDGWIVRLAGIDEKALRERIGSSPLEGLRIRRASLGNPAGKLTADAAAGREGIGLPILLGSFPIVDPTLSP